MRRALLFCAAIALAIACGDSLTDPMPDQKAATPPIAFATTTTEDGLSISTDKDDYQPGDTVQFTGYGWQAGDTLDIVLTDDPLTHEPHTWSVNVGADGMFHDSTYVVDEGDLDVKFTLVATSRATGRSLTVLFTDSNINNGVTVTPTPQSVLVGGTANYTVSVPFGGNAISCTAALSIGGLPTGAAATFNPTSVTGASNNTPKTSALSITTTSGGLNPTPPGDFTLTVTATPNSSGCTGGARDANATLNVIGPAAKLGFVQQPTNRVSNQAFSPAPTVQVQDAAGHSLLTSASITVAIDNNPGSGTLNGTPLTQSTVNGVATFPGLSIDKAGIGYTLKATSSGLNDAISSAFDITAGAFNKLAFTTQPGGGTAGVAFLQQPVVTVQDAAGNTITSGQGNNASISLTIQTNPSSGTLTCTNLNNTVTANIGVATFAGCRINNAGNGYRLRASNTLGGTTRTIDSDPFNIVPAIAATNLTASPATGTYGGQVNLSATLKAGTNPVSGKSIAFTLNGNAVGSATTNGSGVATLSNVFLTNDGTSGTARIAAGTFATGVGASFAGDASFSGSSGTAQLTVNQKSLTPSITAEDKEYDGNTSATIATRSLTGVLTGDIVSLIGGTATFATKTIGTGKTVTATGLSLDGADKGNYVLSATTATTTASITEITLTGHFTAQSRPYNGNTNAMILTRTLTGNIISGDQVSLTGGTAHFDTKTVGTGKTVTGTGFTLSGDDADNYKLASTTLTTTANITAITLTGHFTADNKEYDRTTDATILTRTLTGGVIVDDDVSLTDGTATFDNKNVGTDKDVTGTGFTLSGTDAVNYLLASSTLTTTANITQRPITVTATGVDREYNGNASATVTLSDDRIAGDILTAAYTTASFNDKNAGMNKPVSVSGISISGTDAGNYKLTSTTASTTANITPKTITGHFTADNKVYDGTVDANILTRTLTGVIGDDDVNLYGGTATFDDKNAGNGKTVTGIGFTLSGADKGNYRLASSILTTTANITPRSVTGSFTASNKIYDGNTAAAIATRSLGSEVISGDDVSLAGGTAYFADKNVGDGKMVTGTGFTLSGSDKDNYQLVSTTLTTTANITPRTVTGHFTVDAKVYDGNTAATIHSRTLDNVVGSDDVTLNGGTATFADKNAGTHKVVTGTGFTIGGTAVGNYQLASSTITSYGDILQRPVTVTADAKSKLFGDPDPAFTYQITSGSLVAGDAFSGALTRDPDETVGSHPILQGTLTLGANYDLTYVRANLVINPWRLAGFYQPVDMPVAAGAYNIVWNTVKNGSTVPFKFEVFKGASELKDLGVVQPLFTKEVACVGNVTDAIELTATGGTVLRFDTSGDQFIYNWQTPRKAGYCYQVTMKTADASTLVAYFQLK